MKLTLVRHSLGALAGLAALILLSVLFQPYRDFQLAQISYLLCGTAGLTIMTGLSGQISVGQGAFMATGAYTTALLTNHLRWGLVPVLLASVLVSMLLGLVVGMAAARLRGPYLAALTLALAVGFPALVDYRGLAGLLEGQNGLTVSASAPPLALGADFPPARWQAWVAGGCAIVTLWFLANLSRSRYGRSMRAVRDDESAAALSGIHVARVQILAFVVAAASAGLGGGLLAWVTSLAAPGAFTLNLSLGLLAGAVLGGLGSLAGALWGSLLLVLVSTWTSDLASADQLSPNVANNLPGVIYGTVLILVMIIFPGGIQHGLRRLFAWVTKIARDHRHGAVE
ncbi:branched-chain amino acid ABC transporter permease [Kitasatospora indigofera]|uniref:branched-chain amino acid ABC transporter permease n=1 Tax=Kitasatospora indigofera TaxID=67307 RepID=UPI0036A31431